MSNSQMNLTSLNTETAAARVGLTEHLLDMWARGPRPIVQPTVPAHGRGRRRQYRFRDLVTLVLARELRAVGVRTAVIRVAAATVQNEVRGIDTPEQVRTLAEAWVVVDPRNETAVAVRTAPELEAAAELADPVAIVLDVAAAARALVGRRGRRFSVPGKTRRDA